MAEDAWVDFVAGWCSGGAAVLVCQPIDTILTRYQASANMPTTRDAKGLVSSNGIRSLWRGSSAMISAVPFQNALLMSGYGMGTRLVSEEHVLWGAFFGGCTGGVVQSFLMSPVELVKVKQQVIGVNLLKTSEQVTRGLFHVGANSGWRGLNATLLRDGIPHGVWFASYQWCKDTMDVRGSNGENDDSSIYNSFTVPIVSGAFAATTAWGVGYPADLIKTRIQASSSQMGIWETAMELRQEPGGLYRGFGLKLLRAIPASMVGFTVYEFVKGKMIGE